jgi:hypothetical protein
MGILGIDAVDIEILEDDTDVLILDTVMIDDPNMKGMEAWEHGSVISR